MVFNPYVTKSKHLKIGKKYLIKRKIMHFAKQAILNNHFRKLKSLKIRIISVFYLYRNSLIKVWQLEGLMEDPNCLNFLVLITHQHPWDIIFNLRNEALWSYHNLYLNLWIKLTHWKVKTLKLIFNGRERMKNILSLSVLFSIVNFLSSRKRSGVYKTAKKSRKRKGTNGKWNNYCLNNNLKDWIVASPGTATWIAYPQKKRRWLAHAPNLWRANVWKTWLGGTINAWRNKPNHRIIRNPAIVQRPDKFSETAWSPFSCTYVSIFQLAFWQAAIASYRRRFIAKKITGKTE